MLALASFHDLPFCNAVALKSYLSLLFPYYFLFHHCCSVPLSSIRIILESIGSVSDQTQNKKSINSSVIQ